MNDKKFGRQIIDEIFPTKGKEIVNQTQEAETHIGKTQGKTCQDILIKLTETKHKERILKAAREKQQVTY